VDGFGSEDAIEHEIPLGNLRMKWVATVAGRTIRAEEAFSPPVPSKIFPSHEPGNPSRKKRETSHKRGDSFAESLLQLRGRSLIQARVGRLGGDGDADAPHDPLLTRGTARPATLSERTPGR